MVVKKYETGDMLTEATADYSSQAVQSMGVRQIGETTQTFRLGEGGEQKMPSL